MSSRFIGGKPRGGKTLRMVWFLVQTLINTQKNIVTNLPLRLDALQEYCEEHGIKALVFHRVRVLTLDETDEFYRYRGRDSKGNDHVIGLRYDAKDPREVDSKMPLDIEPLREDPQLALGVDYFIDEVHVHFNARKYQKVADVALWYMSQHAKLSDEVWLCTQSISNVVKQFRDLAQEFRYVRNRRKEKFGAFKSGNNFVERVHLEMVQPGTDREPIETNEYELDAEGIASLYDTSAGVGVAGGGSADKGKDAKGLPYWTVWAGFAAVMALAWWGAGYVPQLLNSGLKEVSGLNSKGAGVKVTPVRPGGVPPVVAVPAVTDRKPIAVDQLSRDVEGAKVQPPPHQQQVWVDGYLVRGNRITLRLSDGRVLTEDDGEIVRVTRNFAMLRDGKKIYLRKPGDQIASSSASPKASAASSVP